MKAVLIGGPDDGHMVDVPDGTPSIDMPRVESFPPNHTTQDGETVPYSISTYKATGKMSLNRREHGAQMFIHTGTTHR